MFRFPPSHGCLPPVGWGGLGFTALLPVAGRSGCLSAGAVSVSCSASLRPTVASYPRAGVVSVSCSASLRPTVASHPQAGVVSVSRSFTLRFPPSHGASTPAGRGGPRFTPRFPPRPRRPGRSLPRRAQPRPSGVDSPRTCPLTAVARTSTLRERGHDLRQRIVAQIGRPGGSSRRRYSRNTAKK